MFHEVLFCLIGLIDGVGEEFPLTGNKPVSCLLNEVDSSAMKFPADADLLGPSDVYEESVAFLQVQRLLSPKMEKHQLSQKREKVVVHMTHPVVKNPWTRVSLRTIEPLSYLIVDKSHPLQANRTDKLHDPRAVLDTIPYSRVFYHAVSRGFRSMSFTFHNSRQKNCS